MLVHQTALEAPCQPWSLLLPGLEHRYPHPAARSVPAAFLCSGRAVQGQQGSAMQAALGCAFPFLCTPSAFQPQSPSASLESVRWEITSVSPFQSWSVWLQPRAEGSHPQLDPAVPWIRRCSPFPARCPPSWHTCDPPQLPGTPTPPCCLLLLRWNPTSCREQHSIEPSWLCVRAQCATCAHGEEKRK